MASKSFYAPEAKGRVSDEIRAIELQTSAEVVVALRRASGTYRHVDLGFGIVFATAALLAFLFSPVAFDDDMFPFQAAGLFALGVATSILVPWLKRVFTSRKLQEQSVATAAKAAFYDLGVSRTSGRSGILLFISMFERRVEVVTDIGIDPKRLGDDFAKSCAALNEAIKGPDLEAYLTAMRSLGPVLGAEYPRSEDDVNELADEVAT